MREKKILVQKQTDKSWFKNSEWLDAYAHFC